MISKLNYYILSCAVLILLFTACKKEDKGYAHNPSAAITISKFLPEQGQEGNELLITGSNFSSDTGQVKVSINGIQARVIASNEKQIMALVPAKTGDGPVVVTIGEQSGSSEHNFNYLFSYEVSTLAGSGNRGSDDGKGAFASFNFNGVRGQLSVDDSLNVYVPDGGNQKIRKVSFDGTVTTIAGTGANGYEDGKAGSAKFNNPCGTAVDATGNIYVAERNGRRIRRITPDGMVSTWAYPSGNGGNELTSVVINKNTGAVYWSDFYGDGVYQLKNGTVQRVINHSLPCTIAIDAQGNIYATHYDDQAVLKYTYDASADKFDNGSIIAGKLRVGGCDDGIGTNATFDRPWGIAIDSKRNLYVSGQGGGDKSNCVRMITTGNNEVKTIAGQAASAGFVEGMGDNAKFNRPTGVVVDKNGDMYVLDMDNNRIRKITVR
ncbi:IPT/TIG domain-containing protein [Danxiaibacter flavus]|uniref:IPT/TIG domain-containing protein n=1 Tax=Danxiaibacter flavus TaxID=3049108 RepID=A0ABV3ZFN8_9BACT|nr:IPT/TIG domain-containing protein [Chitinophagaceae bacterium DXS]